MSGSTDPVLLDINNVTRRYPGNITALADVTLRITAGETVAVTGRSGSGKSTFLSIAGLLDTPDTGTVTINGYDTSSLTDRQRAHRRATSIGFIFQRAHLIGPLTATENVALGLRYTTIEPAVVDAVARNALTDVGLGHRLDAAAHTLSGGEMQRVAIARVLARPARLWLADEPTGNLDYDQSHAIIELLRTKATEHNAALIVVTHESDIAAVLDRTVILRDGHITSDTRSPTATPRQLPTTPGHQAGRTPLIPPPDGTPSRPPRPTPLPRRQAVANTISFTRDGLRANRRRTISAIAATTIAVALTITAIGLGHSARLQVSDQFDAQQARQVSAELLIPPDTTLPAGASATSAARSEPAGAPSPADATTSSRTGMRFDDLGVYPGVDDASHWTIWSNTTITNTYEPATSAQLAVIDPSELAATDTTITWAATDYTLDEGETVIGTALANRLHITQIDLQPEITIAGTTHRVVGIITTSRIASAPGTAFTTTPPPNAGQPDLIEVHAETAPGSGRNIAALLPDIVDPYRTADWTVAPVLRADRYRASIESDVTAALTALAAVAGLAGLVVIVCVNLLNVTNRTAEFGVRRAFGATRASLAALVTTESVICGALGATFGLLAGYLTVMAVTIAANWHPVFDPALIAVAAVAATIFGTIGAVAPAYLASKIEPADAVRS